MVGMVLDAREINENEHLATRDFFVPIRLADGRQVQFPGAPARLSRTPWRLRRSAPRLGTSDELEARLPQPICTATPARVQPAGPLAGVRAVVLTQAWSGTYAAELLALLGAEVIQIEARSRIDSWRGDYSGTLPAAVRDPACRQRPWHTSGLYNSVNLNKLALTLDRNQPRRSEELLAFVR